LTGTGIYASPFSPFSLPNNVSLSMTYGCNFRHSLAVEVELK